MSDLSEVLPHFDQKPWKHLTFSLDKKGISTSELITYDPKWLAKHVPLPLREVERMAKAVTQALYADLDVKTKLTSSKPRDSETAPPKNRHCVGSDNARSTGVQFISSLDRSIDEILGGGVPVGYVTEIVGESATGKSQFAHALLLAATLKPPYGLGKAACYITTEDDLQTTRLEQIINTNPLLENMTNDELPNLDHIFTIKINTLAEQESVLAHRLKPEIKRKNIGLVVVDSIAAHFRAHFGGNNPEVLAARAVELQHLGKCLRQLAHEDKIAVVVTNQVSDRFNDMKYLRARLQVAETVTMPNDLSTKAHHTQSRNLASRTQRDELLSLDYQQLFFTGWGDDLSDIEDTMKTPALGLTWTNQLDARIALKISEKHGNIIDQSTSRTNPRTRFMRLVFASWTASSRIPLQYELRTQGLVGIPSEEARDPGHIDASNDESQGTLSEEDSKFLDPKYWEDDINLNEEF